MELFWHKKDFLKTHSKTIRIEKVWMQLFFWMTIAYTFVGISLSDTKFMVGEYLNE